MSGDDTDSLAYLQKLIIISPATLPFGHSETGGWSHRDAHWVDNFDMDKYLFLEVQE